MKKIIYTILLSTFALSSLTFAQEVNTSNYCPNIKGKMWRGATGNEVKELQKFLKKKKWKKCWSKWQNSLEMKS
jgi:hypothetical protein